MAAAPERLLPELEQWVPEDAVIDILGKRARRRPHQWHVELPAFRISESGDSRDEAVARARGELLSYFSEAARAGKTYEEAEEARKSLLQTFAVVFLLLLAFKAARDKATWWRVPGELLLGADWEDTHETLEILDDNGTMAALRESDEDLEAGRVRPYEDVRRDLGLGLGSS